MGAVSRPHLLYYEVVQSAMMPFAASFLAHKVSSVTTWRVVLSPVLANATFFVPRKEATSHMSSCMMNTSRERFSRDGMNSTVPQGVTYTAKDLTTRSSSLYVGTLVVVTCEAQSYIHLECRQIHCVRLTTSNPD